MIIEHHIIPTEKKPYTMVLRKVRYSGSLEFLQQEFERVRDESGEGASTFPNGRVVGNGAVYWFSYNGRLWDRKPGLPDARLVKRRPEEVTP